MSLALQVDGDVACVVREGGEVVCTLRRASDTGSAEWWQGPLSGVQFEHPEGSGQQWKWESSVFVLVEPPELAQGQASG